MTEKWKIIKGFENYKISNTGKVKMLNYNGRLKKTFEVGGYLKTHLNLNGKYYHKYIHRLVAQHFILNKFNKPEVNHKDRNKKNNLVSNLEWCTRQENVDHLIKTGISKRGKSSKYYKKDLIKDHLTNKYTRIQLAKKYKCSLRTVYNIIKKI